MILTENYVWLPALSGFLVQLLNLLEIANLEPARRPNLKDWIYWIPYFVGPLAGGFVGYLSFSNGENFTPMLGAQVGVSAPLFFKGLANIVPQKKP